MFIDCHVGRTRCTCVYDGVVLMERHVDGVGEVILHFAAYRLYCVMVQWTAGPKMVVPNAVILLALATGACAHL
jgi:hypothetical protein